jgi:hypothetical protein
VVVLQIPLLQSRSDVQAPIGMRPLHELFTQLEPNSQVALTPFPPHASNIRACRGWQVIGSGSVVLNVTQVWLAQSDPVLHVSPVSLAARHVPLSQYATPASQVPVHASPSAGGVAHVLDVEQYCAGFVAAQSSF